MGIDSLLRRILETKNYKGQSAWLLEKRYGIKKPNGVWDCNDRAEWAEAYLKERGYSVKRVIEPTQDPKVNHVFLRVEKDGVTEDVLRFKK